MKILDIDLTTIRVSKTGLVSGVVCMRVNSKVFPEKEWDDFAARILAYWITNLVKFHRHIETGFKMFFFEGPIEVFVDNQGEGRLRIRCMFQDDCEIDEIVSGVDLRMMIAQSLEDAKAVQQIIISSGVDCTDEPDLNESIRLAGEILELR